MKDLLRTAIAAVVGAAVALAVVLGQPAVAGQLDKAKAKKVTSAMIKNGTIKTKDLSAEVRGPLVKAQTALQAVKPGSVGSAEIADGSLTSADLLVARGAGAFDFPNMTPGQCNITAGLPTGHDLTGAFLLVSSPADVAGAVQIDARPNLADPTQLEIVLCNVGTAAFNPPVATYEWGVLAN